MYTQINLKKILDTLPPYEKVKLEQNDIEHVNVCLDDIINTMSKWEIREFILNGTLSGEIMNQLKYHGVYNFLDSLDIDVIISYLESLGYNVRTF